MPLHWKAHGDPTDQPCMLLHGWPDDPAVFDALVARLTGAGDSQGRTYWCLLPDMSRGASLKANVASVRDKIREVTSHGQGGGEASSNSKHSKVLLIAHDWGAVMGWRLQKQVPECISQLVALSIPHQPRLLSVYSTPLLAILMLYQLLNAVIYAVGRIPLIGRLGDVAATALLKLLLSHSGRDPQHPMRARLHERASQLMYWYYQPLSVLLAISIWIPNFDWKLKAVQAAPIRVPVLFLRGSKEVFSSAAIEQQIRSSHPLARAQVVAGGHWFYLERPQEVLEIIAQWLGAGGAGGTGGTEVEATSAL